LTKVDNVDTVKNLITESLADGDIKDAIATSYAGVMGQFNGLLQELQELKKQLQELKLNPSAAVPSPQLPITNGELTIDNYQLPDVESDLTSDTQSPIINDQLPLWDKVLMKNPVDSIRKQLKKKDITKTAEEIKQTFLNAGFDGSNHQSLREEVIKTLSQE
jgi:hypothetical protein